MAHKFLRDDGWFQQVIGSDIGSFSTSSSTTTGFLTFLTNSTTANIALTSTATTFDGPSVSQGSSGTWYAYGHITVLDTANAFYSAKLWDGSTVIDSVAASFAANLRGSIPLAGVIASPAGNIKVSVVTNDVTSASIKFNDSGFGKDSSITVIRIG